MTMKQPFRADRTEAIATCVPTSDYRPCWRTWRIVVPLLTLLFLIAPAALSAPNRGPMPASIAPPATMPVQAGVHRACPPPDLCPTIALAQALPRLPSPLFLPLALAVLVLAMHWRHRMPTVARDWWWPPGRRRALLQVFLI